MTDAIIVAVLSLVGTLVGSLAGIMQANKLMNFKIESVNEKISTLEKKVEKHNNLVERVALLEHDEDTQWKRIDELRDELKEYTREEATT